MNCYYNNSLARYLKMKKPQELITEKYYKPLLHYNIKAYIKNYDIYLIAFKVVRYKLYEDLKLQSILIHQWKDLSIDFVIRLTILTNYKGEIYNSILIIIH